MKIVIIGAGPAGRFAAMHAAEEGNDVTLIENRYIGGKCLNQACMVVCAFSDVIRHLRDAQQFYDIGVMDSVADVNLEKVTGHIKEIQKKIRRIITKETVNTGVEFVHGTAVVDSDKKVVSVFDDEYSYDKLLVCTGSSPFLPNIKGVENALTYADTLKLSEVPEKVVIIGGGSTAAEYASIFSHLGSQVDVLCRSHFLKVLNDDEVEEFIVSNMLKNTMIHENVKIEEITPTSVITNYGEIEGTVLLATGVKPNSDIVKNIVELDEKGFIKVDKYLQTSDESIYAAGDVIGGILSTPVSRMEGMAAIKNIMGKQVTPDYSLIPMTITLAYDVSYLLGTDLSDNGKLIKLPGAAGPSTFWYTLDGKNGFTKEVIDITTNEVKNIISIFPSSNIALPYMVKMIKDGIKADDFDNFLEIHPSTDGISKLTEYYKRFA